MSRQPVLIDGQWKSSAGSRHFQALNPATRDTLPEEFPVSPWSEIDEALSAAESAFLQTRLWPGERFAKFLETFADAIDRADTEIAELASLETALPVSPRLKDGELPRTTGQLRQAAAAARSGSWRQPILDTQANIRSRLAPLGPVVVMGPNNFPLAFNGISGGDFAAAVAAGNPVIAKGHPAHPRTTQKLAELAHAAAEATDMPSGFVQLIYRCSHEDGAKLVSDPRVGATGYTGSRHAGLALKAAADTAGKPIYLELSSINPVVVLPGALSERGSELADEFVGSCLMGTGQFCTNPGLVLLLAGEPSETFIQQVAEKFQQAPAGILLAEGVLSSISEGVETLKQHGADVLAGGQADADQPGIRFQNTLLRTTGSNFLQHAAALQTEAFGNESLIVVCDDLEQLCQVACQLEGNLTGCIYSGSQGQDDAAYTAIEPHLRQRVGRLLNDKMPTGVAVTAAMNHGGPFPATGHPVFTAVGLPTAIQRFTMLQCYDNVRPQRLPAELADDPGDAELWRLVDGRWHQGAIR